MEWEPLPASSNLFNWDYSRAHLEKASSNFSPLASEQQPKLGEDDTVSHAEKAMMEALRPGDVLLGENRLYKYSKGTTLYRSQIGRLRANLIYAQDPTIRLANIRNILQSVWSVGGRFLQYQQREGCITILSNDEATAKIGMDLQRGFRSSNTRTLKSKAKTKQKETSSLSKKGKNVARKTRESTKSGPGSRGTKAKLNKRKKKTLQNKKWGKVPNTKNIKSN